MADIETRVEMIGTAILGTAKKQSEQLHTQAEQYKTEQMQQFEAELERKLHAQLEEKKAQLRQQTVQAVAKEELNMKQKLLLGREALAQMVFEAVKQRLLTYSATPEYQQRLKDEIEKALTAYPYENSELGLTVRDLSLAEELALPKGCSAVADAEILLGGFRLVNREAGVIVDETLDARLEDEKTWFYKNSGLILE